MNLWSNYPKQIYSKSSLSSSIKWTGDTCLEYIWLSKEILGGRLTGVLPSKVLINFEHGFCRGFKLKELTSASLLRVINGNVLLCLYDNIVRGGRACLRLVWFVCPSVSVAFDLMVDSIGASFPSTWFVNTNETCKIYFQMSVPWNGNQMNK